MYDEIEQIQAILKKIVDQTEDEEVLNIVYLAQHAFMELISRWEPLSEYDQLEFGKTIRLLSNRLNRARSRYIDRLLNPDLYHEQDLEVARALDSAHKIAQSLKREVARINKRFQVAQLPWDISQIAVTVVDQSFPESTLTPAYLTERLGPYLQAVFELQYVIDMIHGQSAEPARIVAITQNSPFSITFEGIAQAFQVIRNFITPWRREHEKEMARLEEEEKAANIALRQAEKSEKEAQATKTRNEAKLLKVEMQKREFELQAAKINLVLEILRHENVKLTETERLTYMANLLPPVEALVKSELHISL
jgi:hypothetical protein